MPKPITAISINREAKDAMIALLDEHGVPIKDIIDRFDRTVFIFRRSASVFIARVYAEEIEGAAFKVLTIEEFREIKLAAAPKKEMYRPREASTARRRFDRVHNMDRTIRWKTSGAAHKGWVTKKEYLWRIEQGLFTHSYRVEYTFHGNRHVEEGLCVAEEQAKRAANKARRMIKQKFIGAEITSKQVIKLSKKEREKHQAAAAA